MSTNGTLTEAAQEAWGKLVGQAGSVTKLTLREEFVVAYETREGTREVRMPRGTEVSLFCNHTGGGTLPRVKAPDPIVGTFFGHDCQINLHRSGAVKVSSPDNIARWWRFGDSGFSL